MSRYNPYEPKKDRKRRIQSNISICVIIGLFIFGIVLLMLPEDYGGKYYFESTTTDMHDFSETLSETNEFYDMYTAMLEPTNEFEMDGGFSDSFPTVAKMLNMDTSVYDENKPYIYYGGKYMAVSQCFYSTNEHQKTLDVALFGFDAQYENNTASISIDEITRFSLIYNTSSGTINYMKYSPSEYNMQIVSFTVSLGGDMMKNVGYELTLEPTKKMSETDKKLIANTIVDVTNNSVHKPTVEETDEQTVITLTQSSNQFADRTARYKFDMAGDTPELLKSYVITADFQSGTRSDDIQYSFTIS